MKKINFAEKIDLCLYKTILQKKVKIAEILNRTIVKKKWRSYTPRNLARNEK